MGSNPLELHLDYSIVRVHGHRVTCSLVKFSPCLTKIYIVICEEKLALYQKSLGSAH